MRNSLSLEIVSNMVKAKDWHGQISQFLLSQHCVKSFRIRGFSGPYSVQIRENKDQKNSGYGHFSRSASWLAEDSLQSL